MSIESFFKGLEQDIVGGAKKVVAVTDVAFSDTEEFIGVALGLGEVVVSAADPALTPIVTPLVTAAQTLLAEAKSAVDAAGADVEAQAAAAAPYIANLTAAGVQLTNAAAPGIKAIANAAKAATGATA